ncbi:MAG: hypothetical protein KJZ65_00960 [Phycisphaerales bacterium]|nr:hypothetical protein [Phycisphaerales bacterium]
MSGVINARIVGATLLICCVGSTASASFVRFKACVRGCVVPPRGYWNEVACILDCELELAGCIVTLGHTLSYSPNPDPECLNRIVGNGTLPGNRYLPGDFIPFNLQLVRVEDHYAFGGSIGVNDQASYLAFRSGALYNGPAQIVGGSVRAMRLADASLPDDPFDAANHPAWASAMVLYSGDFSGLTVFDTSGMSPGIWILLTSVEDAALGTQFGFSAMALVPAPGVLMVGALGMLPLRRRRA